MHDKYNEQYQKLSAVDEDKGVEFFFGLQDLFHSLGIDKYRRAEVVKAAPKSFLQFQELQTQSDAVEKALKVLSPGDNGDVFNNKHSKIHNIKVRLPDGTPDRAYFCCTNRFSFRHAGDSEKKPKYVVVRKLTEHQHKVIVHYSASGSGKSVEAAASSVTRDAHLTIVLSISDDIEPDVNALTTTRKMARSIGDVLRKCRKEIANLLTAAKGIGITFKAVVAIDEASSCPNIVRSVLRDKTVVTGAMDTCLVDMGIADEDDMPKIEIQVTIAGTGVGQSTLGSPRGSFVVVSPSHEDPSIRERLFDRELESHLGLPLFSKHRDIPSIQSFEHLRTCLPVVATLMQNGRMGSIAFAEMNQLPYGGPPIKEASLVDKIVSRYMHSNGLCPLAAHHRKDAKRAAAALALAVHLFRNQFKTKPPTDRTEFHEWSTAMHFGFPANSSIDISVQQLVANFGLLEPVENFSDIVPGTKEISPPFVMKEAQQLVAAHMLEVSVEGMLELSPWGIEVFSTHVVKTVIAASCAIDFKSRPSLQDALKTIGFGIDANATSESVQKQWADLSDWIVVGCNKNSIDPKLNVANHETMAFAVEPRIIGDSDDEEEDKYKYLQIDCNAAAALKGMEENETMTETKLSARPIAFGNYGNSQLPDGFVTFHAKNNKMSVCKKWNIMVQSKDYFGTSIDAKSLNKLAERSKSHLLDSMFGKNRLFAVASGHKSVVASHKTKVKGECIPYNLSADHSMLMKGLLELLSQNEKSRIEKFAVRIPHGGERKRKYDN